MTILLDSHDVLPKRCAESEGTLISVKNQRRASRVIGALLACYLKAQGLGNLSRQPPRHVHSGRYGLAVLVRLGIGSVAALNNTANIPVETDCADQTGHCSILSDASQKAYS